MRKNYKRFVINSLIISLILLRATLTAQCSLTYYGGILYPASGTSFYGWTGIGPGQYFALPVLYGGSYDISTCGAPICTQLTGYDNSASSVVFLNTGSGPFCANCNASVGNFVPSFTGYCYMQLTQYYCGAGGSSSINLYLRQNNNISFTSSSAAMCSGQTRILSATPANVVSTPGGYGDPGTFYGTGVSGNVFTAPVVASPTNYTITYTFGFVSQTQVITVNPLPTVVANTSAASICSGNSTTLFGSGANTYVWTGGVTNNVAFVPSGSGTYFVTGTSAAGCTSTNSASQLITVNPNPTVSISSPTNGICAGNNVTLSGSGATTYNWSTGSTFNSITVSPSSTTTYTLTGTSALGCTDTETFTVNYFARPTMAASASSNTLCFGSPVTLNATGANTYTWTASNGAAVTNGTPFTPTVTATYSANGTSTAGCTSTLAAVVNVTVHPTLTLKGNGNNVPQGSSTSSTNNTDFGTNTAGTFSITNTGAGTLTLGTIFFTGPNASNFSVTTTPAGAVTTGTTGFVISFTPTNTGISTATVNIPSNSCNTPNYTFVITASTTPANALSFNGSQFLVTPLLTSTITASSDITIETWFKPTGAGVIVNELGAPALNGGATGWHDSQIEVVGSGSVYVRVWNVPAVFVGTVSFGTWNHVALRYNNAKGITDGLLNGVPSAIVSNGTRQAPSTLCYGVGMIDGTNMGSGSYFTGQIDELRIWNSYRTVCEIQQYMNCEIPTSASGLVVNYHFNQGVPSGLNTSVTTATDAANGNSGTLNGFALTGSASNWVNPGAVTSGSVTPASVSASITISGNGNNVPQGSSTSATNNTDWGTSTSKTFSITNTGSGPLNIGGIYFTGTNASNFSVTTLPAQVVNTGSTGFVVTLTPTNSGVSTATVNVISNDCSKPNFTFVITASTTPAGALNFDGTNDFVSIANTSSLNAFPLTVEAQIKTTYTGAPLAAGIVSKYATSSFNGWNVHSSSGFINAFYFKDASNYVSYPITSTVSISDNNWHHVALVVDATGGRIYIDGVQAGPTSPWVGTPGAPTTAQNVNLGIYDVLYPGSMDEVRIWNVARTQCELQQFKNCEIATTASGLMANYHFNQGIPSGLNGAYTALTDAAGSNTGSLINFALTGSSSNWISPGAVISGSVTPATVSASITVSGNGNNVPMGTATFGSNNTDFGTATSKTFSISNSGGGVLNISSIYLTGTNAGQFSITSTPLPVITTGTTGFAITLTPTNTGVSTATVNISTNDCGKPTFSFVITASTTPANALNLDGSNDYVSIPSSTNIPIGNSPYTIESWIKPNTSGLLGIAGWGNYNNSNQVNAFRMGTGGVLVNYWWGNDLIVSAPTLTNGSWHHVAATFDGSMRAIYVDGVMAGYDFPSGHSVPNANNLNIGVTCTTGCSGGLEFFNGSLDEVRIWNVGRSQCEIQQFMNCEITSTASGLVANYHFNQGIPSGTNTTFPYNTLADAAGANTGTLTNFALSGNTSNWISPGGVANGYTTTTAPSVTLAAFGNGNSITAGSTSPIVSNNTSFGNLCVNTGTTSRTFSVTNTGTNVLYLNLITLSGSPAFTLGTYPSSLSAGGSATVPITYSTGASSVVSTATVKIISNDCSNPNYSFVINATVNPQPTVAATGSVLCFGNTATLIPTGALSYTLTSGTVTANGSTFAVTPSVTSNYSITGTSAAGCLSSNTAIATVTINSLPTVTAGASSTVICNTQTITVNGSGADTYTWTASAGTATNGVAFSPGTTASYSVVGTNTLTGCTSTNVAAVTVTVNALPTVTANSSGSAICLGQTVSVSGLGANTYTWLASAGSNPSNGVAFSPTATASYSVTGTNITTGCTSTNVAAVTVTVNSIPVVTASSSSSVICNTQTVSVNGSGASTYTWVASNGTATNGVAFSPSVTANYSVTGTSTAGCTSTNVAAVTVTVNALPVVTAGSTATVICNTQTISLNGSGANTYTWVASTGTATNGVAFSPSTTANYSVSGTSTLTGCTSTNAAVVTVSVNSLPTLTANSSATAICFGQTVSVFGTGANTFTWVASAGSNPLNGIPFTPTATASYTVSGTNTLSGCTNSNVAALTVTVNPLPVVNASASSTLICNTQTITVNGAGANTYTWLASSGTATNGVAFAPSVTATYSVSGTNSLTGCTSTNVAALTVSVNALPTITIAGTGTVCNSFSSTLTAAGAVTYTWNTGPTTSTISVSPSVSTIYTATGTGTNSCINTNTFALTVNPLPTVTANSSNSAICIGQTLSVFAFGANTFTWAASSGSNPFNGIPFNPTTTVTYSVSGTNTLTGCTSTNAAAVTVTVNALPVVSAAATSTVICNTQTIAVSGSGANTYTWVASSGTATNGVAFSPSTTATYSVAGTSTLTGCTSTNAAFVAVTVNTLPVVSANSSTNALCIGNPVTLNGTGANTYTWVASSGNATNNVSFSPTTTATYSVSGSNTLTGCTSTNAAAVTVTVYNLPVITANSTSTVICNTQSVTLSGGGANTYTWNASSGTATNNVAFAPSVTATYSVSGTSSVGCLSANPATIAVTVNTLPIVSAATSTSAVCFGQSVTLNGSGANTYSWAASTGTAGNGVPFSPTATANYTVSGTNTLTGCTSTNVSAVTVTVYALPSLTINGNASICNGGNATLTVSGANTYTWNTSSNSASVVLNPSSSTPYTVTGTDLNGCVNSSVKTVSVGTLPVVSLTTGSAVICANGTTTFNATGAFTYTLTSLSGTVPVGTSYTPAATANYSLVGTNSAGCTSTNNAVVGVTVNPLPVISISGNGTICNTFSSTLTASGASTYTWNTSAIASSIVASPSTTTTYTAVGTNSNSCINSNTFVLTVNPLPIVTAASTSSAVCIGQSVTLNGGGANTYTWNATAGTATNNVAFTPTITATYSVVGTSTAACTSTNPAFVTVTVYARPSVTAATSASVICNTQSITLNGSGANTYTWSTASGTVANSTAFAPSATTNYSLAGTNTLTGCTSTNNPFVAVTVNTLPVVSAASSTAAVCIGSPVTLTGGGANTYTWSASSGTATNNVAFSPTTTANYTVSGTNTLTGCTSTNVAALTVTVYSLPSVTASVSNSVICFGQSVTVTGSGANTYTLVASSGSATNNVSFVPLVTANYSVTGTSTNGCISSNTAVTSVTVNALPSVSAAATSSAICFGQSVTLNGSGANTYTWSSASGTLANNSAFAPASSATYSLAGTNTLTGCTSTNNPVVAVTVNTLPVVSANTSTTSLCIGSAVTLNGGGADTYTWTASTGTATNNVAFSPTTTATYTVIGTNSLTGCTSTNVAAITLTVYSLPTVSASVSNSVICFGQSVTVNGAGANTYTWTASNGSVTNNTAFNPSVSATYSVSGTSTNGCISSNTAVTSITVNALPVLTVAVTRSVICLNDSTKFTASGANTYTWSGGIVNGNYFKPTASATYTLNATDVNSCTNSAVASVTVNSLPNLSVVPSVTASCSGQSTTLTATGASSYSWGIGSQTGSVAVFAPTVSTVYTLQGVDANGCVSVTSFSQPVNPCLGKDTAYAVIVPASCHGKNDGKINIYTSLSTYTDYAVTYIWGSGYCPNNNCNELSGLVAGTYSVKVVLTYTVANNLVRTDTTALNPLVVPDGTSACDLVPYTGVTPNNDGSNDVWFIPNIELYPNNKVTVFNRWGVTVAEIRGYDNVNKYWPQISHLDRLPANTYFYIIDPGDGSALIKGWVELIKE